MFYLGNSIKTVDYFTNKGTSLLKQDKWFLIAAVLIFLFVVPQIANDYWLGAILIPLMVFTVAALGLNLLTGYTGQLSLGTGGFMLLGSIAAFNFLYRVNVEGWFSMPLPLALFLAGIVTGLVGVVFGLPSIRIKGFYLIVSTLAAHFFILWFFNAFRYFVNYDHAGVVLLSSRYYDVTWFAFHDGSWFPSVATININNYVGKYYMVLVALIILTIVAKNIVSGSLGRNMMAVRDMEVSAKIVGINVPQTKLIAFFISTFYIGVAGALFSFSYTSDINLRMHELDRAFQILFMIIVGGIGTISGGFLGAAFVYLFNIFISLIGNTILGGVLDSAFVTNFGKVVIGIVIIVLLIKEPKGFVALFARYKQRLQRWPFWS